jgi:hypothetical protein
MIKKINNFLSNNVCNELIGFFESSNNKENFRDTVILNYKNKKILEDLYKLFKISLLLTPADMQIVKWPTGSLMHKHFDTGDQYGILLYLNDNFEGGETIIDTETITPKKGCGVLFSNGILAHSVCQIKKGTRYTLPIWYK